MAKITEIGLSHTLGEEPEGWAKIGERAQNEPNTGDDDETSIVDSEDCGDGNSDVDGGSRDSSGESPARESGTGRFKRVTRDDA